MLDYVFVVSLPYRYSADGTVSIDVLGRDAFKLLHDCSE